MLLVTVGWYLMHAFNTGYDCVDKKIAIIFFSYSCCLIILSILDILCTIKLT